MIKIFTHILESFQIRIKMSNNLSIKEFETMNDFILVSFSDETESIIPLEILKKNVLVLIALEKSMRLATCIKALQKNLTIAAFRLTAYNLLDIMDLGLFGKMVIVQEFLLLNFSKSSLNRLCLIFNSYL